MPKPRKAGRDYGAGSIYQRASDGMWIGTIEAGWNDKGNRRRITVSGRDAETVKAKLRDKRRALELAGDTNVDPRATVRSWADEWLPIVERLFKTEAPAKAVSDRRSMTVPEAVAVLRAATELLPHSSRTAAALLQGMRQGEALGLTWPCVDLEANSLTISWQLQPLPYRIPRDTSSGFRVPDGYEAQQLKGRWHLVRPKSKAGWRVIPLVPWMRTALATWREIAPDSEHGLVWPALDGGPTDPKVDDAEWYGLQGAAEVGHPAGRFYTIHEGRHTTATLLLEARIDPAVIVAILGHSSIVTSQGYMHVDTRQSLDAMTAVAERLQLRG